MKSRRYILTRAFVRATFALLVILAVAALVILAATALGTDCARATLEGASL